MVAFELEAYCLKTILFMRASMVLYFPKEWTESCLEVGLFGVISVVKNVKINPKCYLCNGSKGRELVIRTSIGDGGPDVGKGISLCDLLEPPEWVVCGRGENQPVG